MTIASASTSAKTNEFDKQLLDEPIFERFKSQIDNFNLDLTGSNVPNKCKNEIENQKMLKLARTPYSNDSFYLIENDNIWYVENQKYKNGDKWPKKVSEIFPELNTENGAKEIDAILFDDINEQYLIFRVDFCIIFALF